MPIADFLQGQSFDSDTLRAMNFAFKDICAALGQTDRTDEATGVVAIRLIQLAKAGERDAGRLAAAVLTSLRAN